MLTFQNKYAGNVTSQNGENGILDEIINRIAPKLHYALAVEFGAPTKQYCSNIFPLNGRIEKRYFDINPQEEGIVKAEITPGNVNDILPEGIWLLSIDVDGQDYHIWNAYKDNPPIVIIEVNSSILPPMEEIPGPRGASYMSMLKLGIAKDYFLIVHTGNMIFVKNHFRHLFPEVIEDGIENWDQYFNISHL